MATLTWLHLSDLHACSPHSGWDSGRVIGTLVEDLTRLQYEHGLRPDLIFFTGDAAFGHLGRGPGESLEEQFQEAGTFLDSVRRAFTPEVPLRDLFLVPGNHDVDRSKVLESQTEWLDKQELDRVVKLFQNGGLEWQTVMRRLTAYLGFLAGHGLDHLLEDPQRAIYATTRELNGLRVGIAGFNSAWSCCRNGEKGHLWAAGRWQQGRLLTKLTGADFSIALIHHPPGWLVEQESPRFGRELRQDFRFLLHGHEHQDWIESTDDGFTRIAAGACYDRSDRDNGYNLVRIDLESGDGEVWLRRYDRTGGGWTLRPIHGRADQGVRKVRLDWLGRRAHVPLPAVMPVLAAAKSDLARATGRGELRPGEERRHEVDGTVLLYIPGGEYILGSKEVGAAARPVHRVCLSPFWIAKHPVTNEQYRRFLEANPRARTPAAWHDRHFNQPEQPVVGISWQEANAYCRWAGLRLPSEAQWEAAARGTDGRTFPWGDEPPTPEHGNFQGREGRPTPVGAYPQGAGPFGALDQAGNVWEWCEDIWDPEAYGVREKRTNPVATTGDPAVRCLRGGSWSDTAKYLVAAFRNGDWASRRFRTFGFRCVLLHQGVGPLA